MAPRQGVLGLKKEIHKTIFKNFLLQSHLAQIFVISYCHWLGVLYQLVLTNEVSGFKMAPPQRILGLKHRNTEKKHLVLQNHLLQMLEILKHCLVVLYPACSNEGLRVQNGSVPGGEGALGLTHTNT